MQIQQISVRNPQAAQPDPAGRERARDGNTFRSVLSSQTARTASGGDKEAKASDRPTEKSGEKQAESGTAQQFAPQDLGGAVFPGLLLPVGMQPSFAGISADGVSGAAAVSAVQDPVSGAAALLPAGNAGQNTPLPVTADQTAPADQTTSTDQAAPSLQPNPGSPKPASGLQTLSAQDAAFPETDSSVLAAAPPSGRAGETPAAQIQAGSSEAEAPASESVPSEPQPRVSGQPAKELPAEGAGAAPVTGTSTDAAMQKETAVSGGKLSAQAQDPASKQSEPGKANDPNGLPGLYGGGNVVIRVSGEKAAAAATPVKQVADAAVQQMQNGKNEFRMDLYPESLGKVSVRLTSEHGILTVEIAASDPKTQSMLLSGSEEIRSILQASSGQTVQTVLPDRQAAVWYGQPQDGGGNSGERREKREDAEKNSPIRVESGDAELNTGDFLALIQRLSTFTR